MFAFLSFDFHPQNLNISLIQIQVHFLFQNNFLKLILTIEAINKATY